MHNLELFSIECNSWQIKYRNCYLLTTFYSDNCYKEENNKLQTFIHVRFAFFII